MFLHLLLFPYRVFSASSHLSLASLSLLSFCRSKSFSDLKELVKVGYASAYEAARPELAHQHTLTSDSEDDDDKVKPPKELPQWFKRLPSGRPIPQPKVGVLSQDPADFHKQGDKGSGVGRSRSFSSRVRSGRNGHNLGVRMSLPTLTPLPPSNRPPSPIEPNIASMALSGLAARVAEMVRDVHAQQVASEHSTLMNLPMVSPRSDQPLPTTKLPPIPSDMARAHSCKQLHWYDSSDHTDSEQSTDLEGTVFHRTYNRARSASKRSPGIKEVLAQRQASGCSVILAQMFAGAENGFGAVRKHSSFTNGSGLRTATSRNLDNDF